MVLHMPTGNCQSPREHKAGNNMTYNYRMLCPVIPGEFHADYSGYSPGEGPGAGQSLNDKCRYTACRGGSGGGHAGRGGRSYMGYHSGYSYDSLYLPQDRGSGGGNGSGQPGGRGGGNYTEF